MDQARDLGEVPTTGGNVHSQLTRPTVAERLAAVVALIAVAGAVALLLAGVVRHWQTVLIALGCLAVGVSAGWYAVSRRGLIRLTALVLLPASLAGLVTAMIFASLSVARLLDVLVLGAASVAAGRLALTRSSRERHGARVQLTPVPRPARPVLIMNPKSGGGKAVKFDLERECAQRQIEPIVLHPGQDLLKLAEDAVARGADVIGMAGGDGSQALVASVAARHGIPHVCVPAGTRNHFALDLGLNRADVVGALDAFRDGVERRIDLATVNGRIFVNNASLGLYARVVQAPEYRDAKVRTAGVMLPELLGPDATPLDLRYRGPDGVSHPSAQLILVSNDPYQLDHIGGLGTRERIDLGVLGIVTARVDNAGAARQLALLQAAGQVRRFTGWLEWSAPRFEVGSAGPVDIGVDGEALKMDPPLVFESLPGALRVLLPRKGLRMSPATRAVRVLTGSAIVALSQLAIGREPPRHRPRPRVRTGR
ncbi:MAG TPA: diacylglycerol kinase family protein [Streptosporangiaceae bacterium]|jgi:diacylglycerol kinase family enzyme